MTSRRPFLNVTLEPHGQRLVGHAQRAVAERLPARGALAVEAGAVPRRVGPAVDAELADAARLGADDARDGGDAHAQRRGAGAGDPLAQHVAAAAGRAIAVDRLPAAVALDLQRDEQALDRAAAGADGAAHGGTRPGADVGLAIAHADPRLAAPSVADGVGVGWTVSDCASALSAPAQVKAKQSAPAMAGRAMERGLKETSLQRSARMPTR